MNRCLFVAMCAKPRATGLRGLASRFVAYNGGVSVVQLDWLKLTLTLARFRGEKVVVFGHIPGAFDWPCPYAR